MDITNVSRETIVKQYDEAKAKYDASCASLRKDVTTVFTTWMSLKGIADFCTFKCEDDAKYGELFVTVGGESHGISLRYFKRWKDDGTAKYELTMNYSCFGSFSDSEEAKVKYSIVIGLLAAEIGQLQDVISQFGWDANHELAVVSARLENALEAYDDEVEKAEHDRKVAEVMPYIKVGGKFNVGKEWNGKPLIATIVDMKRKYVDFDRVSARMTREEIADKVITGKWKVRK